MRELFVVSEESGDGFFVLSDSANPDHPDAERFRLEITPKVREAVHAASPTTSPEPESVAATSPAQEEQTAESEPPAPETEAEAPDQPRATREPDPRLSAPLTMRPREIQDRVRAGASIVELAEEMQVAESRVEPFAHPVLLERARIAELARTSHPVRDDGPAKLTLAEVLATAFAARDIDPQGAHLSLIHI